MEHLTFWGRVRATAEDLIVGIIAWGLGILVVAAITGAAIRTVQWAISPLL